MTECSSIDHNFHKTPNMYPNPNGFSVDYDYLAVDDIKDIHKYLMKKNIIV